MIRSMTFGAGRLTGARLCHAKGSGVTALEIVPDQDPVLASWALRRIVDDLADSRRRVRAADARQFYVTDLPSPEAVAHVIKGLRSALFPRHAGGQDGSDQGLDYFVGYTLNTALRDLVGQIKRELRADAGRDRSNRASADGALAIVRAFADRLPAIRDVLATDVRAAFEGDPSAKSPEEVLLSFPGVHAIIHHRLAHALYDLGAPVVARIIAELAHASTGIDIHPGATIGPSFFIDHGTGVVIGETTVIGERVRLYQAVTLGAKRFSVDEEGALVKGMPRHPIVQDDVVIYAGATILGRVTIGRGSVIGGNVWLTRSVPPDSNVVQALARSETFDAGAGI
jgi:serine O-acetyltransferase